MRRTADELDLLLNSPDGESRGLMGRVGDVFPLDPMGHLKTIRQELPSTTRPFGLRYAKIAGPRAGKHEGPTSATSGYPDNSSSEESSSD